MVEFKENAGNFYELFGTNETEVYAIVKSFSGLEIIDIPEKIYKLDVSDSMKWMLLLEIGANIGSSAMEEAVNQEMGALMDVLSVKKAIGNSKELEAM